MVGANMNKGYITQIIGPVLDIKFSEGNLPPIYTAIGISETPGESYTNIVEVQQLLGDNKVRAVSMRSTDGLKRGTEAIDLGTPITVPVSLTAAILNLHPTTVLLCLWCILTNSLALRNVKGIIFISILVISYLSNFARMLFVKLHSQNLGGVVWKNR